MCRYKCYFRFLLWQIILVSTSYRYISEEMSIDIFATANCYYKFPPPKLICELNRWKREELNNKQIDTFQSSGASFDEQFICDTLSTLNEGMNFSRRVLSFTWLENNRRRKYISSRQRRSSRWNADAEHAGGGICVAIFPPFWPAGERKGWIRGHAEWIDACFASHGDIDLFLSRLCQLWE